MIAEKGARNLLAVGQTVTAHGDGVSAERAMARGAGGRRSANPEGGHDQPRWTLRP